MTVCQSTEMLNLTSSSRASSLPQVFVSSERSGVFQQVVQLDSEANQQLSAQLGIRSIPSLILFRNGREVARQSGAFPLPQLMSWLRSQGI